MLHKTKELNEFVSKQIVSILLLTKQNMEQVIEFLQKQHNPYLNNTSVQILNVLSSNTVESFNKILINSEIGYVENNHIVLTKYFEFDSLVDGVKKIPYSLLFIEKFISIEKNDEVCGDKYILVPSNYNVGDNTGNVINNLEAIIDSIDLNIKLYTF